MASPGSTACCNLVCAAAVQREVVDCLRLMNRQECTIVQSILAASKEVTDLYPADIPFGPIVSRVTIEVDVVGSNLTRDAFLQIDRPNARERELAEFDAYRRDKS